MVRYLSILLIYHLLFGLSSTISKMCKKSLPHCRRSDLFCLEGAAAVSYVLFSFAVRVILGSRFLRLCGSCRIIVRLVHDDDRRGLLGRELAADGSSNKRLNIQPHSGRKALCDLRSTVDDVAQQLRTVAFAVHRDFIHLAERFSDILGDFRQSVLDTPHG